jgi:glyoxylase-like metal-dependent hydrolase (beta-lactamase superfamily II)
MDVISNYELHTQETWQTLAELLQISNPLFEKTFFLFGYDFSSNSYLIQGDYLSLIDPGNDYTAFMQLLDLGFRLTDIRKIALTHGHHDHVMGTIELFRGYPGYQISGIEIIMHEAGPEQFKELVRELGCQVTEVRGGEKINLSGLEFEVIHTPGHTLDGVSFYHQPTATLFSGDTVMPHAMAEVDRSAGGRLDHYLYALRTLRKREVRHLLPGHGGVAPNLGRQVIDETFEGLIRKEVGLETPWPEAAVTLAQRGLLEEALFCCDRQLTATPESLPCLEMKAFLLHDLGRHQEAVQTFDQLLAHQAGHYPALMGKGSALLALERFRESVTAFDQALKLKPGAKDALISKGLALYLSGRPEEALDIEEFRQGYTENIKQFLAKSSGNLKAGRK